MNMLLFDETDKLASAESVNEVNLGSPQTFEIQIAGERFIRLKSLLSRLPRGNMVGDYIRVGQMAGWVGRGEVLSMSERHANILVTLSEAPVAKIPVTLVLALPRPKMLRRILRMVGELGVERLVLINTGRVEKSYWQTPVLKTQTLHEYLLAGLAQTGDTVLPELNVHRSFRDFVTSHLGDLVKQRDFLVAHPGDFASCPARGARPICLCVGPEAGFTAYEVDQFQSYGAQLISLGARVLRVETAVPVLLSRMM